MSNPRSLCSYTNATQDGNGSVPSAHMCRDNGGVGTGKSKSIRDLAKKFCTDYIETVGDKHERIDNKSNPKELWALGWRSKIDIIDYISQEKNLTNDENLNIRNVGIKAT